MTQDVTTQADNELLFDPKTITKETIKRFLCKNANDQELIMGLQICREFQLNPLKREVYFIKYGEEPMAVVLGYEVYLKRASRTGNYAGLKTWTEGAVADGTLKGCVEVTVKGWDKPLYHECFYNEYVQFKKDKVTGKQSPNKFWASKPITMIKKVTVAQAFKLAFPDEFAGLPQIAEELGTEDVVDIEVDHTKSRVEQIVEQQFVTTEEVEKAKEVKEDAPVQESKPEAKKEQPKEHKKSKDKDVVKSDTKQVDGQSDPTVKSVIGLIDTQSQGQNGEIIAVRISKEPIANPNTGIASIKHSFLIEGKYYGTWDGALAKQIMEAVDNRIMVKFEYKERPDPKVSGKFFQDIISFKHATTDEVKI